MSLQPGKARELRRVVRNGYPFYPDTAKGSSRNLTRLVLAVDRPNRIEKRIGCPIFVYQDAIRENVAKLFDKGRHVFRGNLSHLPTKAREIEAVRTNAKAQNIGWRINVEHSFV